MAGHIIECGAQAVGGNVAGFTSLPRFVTPGFPLAEIAADGTGVILGRGGSSNLRLDSSGNGR